MNENKLFDQILADHKDDFDFKYETKLIEITEDICRILEESGMNRKDLSEVLGTSKSAVTKMLDGNTNFTLKRLLKVADALDRELSITFRGHTVASPILDDPCNFTKNAPAKPKHKIQAYCDSWETPDFSINKDSCCTNCY